MSCAASVPDGLEPSMQQANANAETQHVLLPSPLERMTQRGRACHTAIEFSSLYLSCKIDLYHMACEHYLKERSKGDFSYVGASCVVARQLGIRIGNDRGVKRNIHQNVFNHVQRKARLETLFDDAPTDDEVQVVGVENVALSLVNVISNRVGKCGRRRMIPDAKPARKTKVPSHGAASFLIYQQASLQVDVCCFINSRA